MRKLNSIRLYLFKLHQIRQIAAAKARKKSFYYRADREKFESVQGAIRDRLAWENGRHAS